MIHPKETKELLYRMFEDHYVSLTVRCPRVLLWARFLLVTGLPRAVPSRCFSNRSKNLRSFMPGVAQASHNSNRLKNVDYYWCGGESSNQLLCLRHVIPPNWAHWVTFNGFSGKRCFVTKCNMNKMNNISNRSSVLPILCEHGQLRYYIELSRTIQTAGIGWKACQRRNRVPSRPFSTFNRSENR